MAPNRNIMVSSPFTAQNFLKYPEWEGDYDESMIDWPTTPLEPNLLFHVLVVAEEPDRWVLVVPEYWVDRSSRHILYPHPTFNICGLYPQEWGAMSFNRRRYPTTEFVEYIIEDFLTPNPVEHQHAKNWLKDVENNIPRQEHENFDGSATQNGSSYKGSGYYGELSIPPSPEVRTAQELETTGELNDSFSSDRRATPLLQQLLPASTSYAHLGGRKPSESRQSVSATSLSSRSCDEVFSPGLTSTVQRNRIEIESTENQFIRPLDHSKSLVRDLPRSTSHSRGILQPGSSFGRGLNKVYNANVIGTKPPGPTTINVQLTQSAGYSGGSAAKEHQLLVPATTMLSQQSVNTVNETRRPRLPSENEEMAYRAKMLKLMTRTVQILEEQRNPKVVHERVLTENARFFDQVLKSNVKLPLTNTSQIEDLNISLINMELSVAMCGFFIVRLKSITSRDQIAKSLMSSILTKKLCAGVQWKKRGNDKRPMIGHMVNLIAVFAVIIKTLLEMNNQPECPLSKLIPVIQQARRILAFESANKEMEDDLIGDAAVQRADRQTQVQIDQRIGEILEAIENFRPPK